MYKKKNINFVVWEWNEQIRRKKKMLDSILYQMQVLSSICVSCKIALALHI